MGRPAAEAHAGADRAVLREFHPHPRVAKTQDRINADYILVVDIRQFGIQAYDGPTANVELSVKIVYQRGGRIAAATVLSSRVAASGTSGAAATLALDQAFSDVLVQMVKWTSRRI